MIDHTAEANRLREAAQESFDRCDTDGYVTQWAFGVRAQEEDLKAWLQSQGGKADFVALFDLAGNLIPAKLVEGKWGPCWGLLASADVDSRVVGWIGAFPRRESTLRNKGYYEGTVRCIAYVTLDGSGTGLSGALSVRPGLHRCDRGFSADVEIIDNGLGAKPEKPGMRRK